MSVFRFSFPTLNLQKSLVELMPSRGKMWATSPSVSFPPSMPVDSISVEGCLVCVCVCVCEVSETQWYDSFITLSVVSKYPHPTSLSSPSSQCCFLAISRTMQLVIGPLTSSTPLETTSTIISSALRYSPPAHSSCVLPSIL